MKTTKVTCETCGIVFEKLSREYRRSEKLGRKHYCTRKCVGKASSNLIPNHPDLNKGYDRSDEYSPFREFLRRARRRNKDVQLTLEGLKNRWEYQEGKCIYSRVQLDLPTKGKNSPIFTASLDRIDSGKGYSDDNIQFVSMAMNYMKHGMSDGETRELIRILRS